MNFKKNIRVIAMALAVVMTLGITVFAASYDSSEDPLISLSYLKNIFKPEIEKEYKEKVLEILGGLIRAEIADSIVGEYLNSMMMKGLIPREYAEYVIVKRKGK